MNRRRFLLAGVAAAFVPPAAVPAIAMPIIVDDPGFAPSAPLSSILRGPFKLEFSGDGGNTWRTIAGVEQLEIEP